MKAVLEFDLNDPDERQEHIRCVKALDMSCILFEIQLNLKKKILSSLTEKDSSDDVVDKIFESIIDLYDEHNINIEELIQ
jgi:hypothetical protein